MIRRAWIHPAIFSALLPVGVAIAADYRPAAREVWTGSYRCEAIERDPNQWPAYYSRVRLTLEEGAARVTREFARKREVVSGQVGPDGTLKLEGAGDAKDGGARWRYRFEGKFEGQRFTAKGAMLAAGSATKLRECAMELTRVSATGGPARVDPAAAAAPLQLDPKPELKPEPQLKLKSKLKSKPEPRAEPNPEPPPLLKPDPPPPAAAATAKLMEGKTLDFTQGNNAAVIQGEVSRESPHRYPVLARKGQTLTATLQTDGARIEIYEPGATLQMQAQGFVAQGTRLKAAPEGVSVRAELTSDGSYQLLVHAQREQASYTLEVAVITPNSASTRPFLTDDRRLWAAILLALAVIGAGLVFYSKRDRRMFRSR